MSHVIIVGGGIAGLATAYELHKRHVPFVLLESAARAGGVILSEEVDGYTIDAGPDSLLVQKPEAVTLCEELGLGGRLVPTQPPRLAFILRGGVLHPLPASSVLGIPTRVGPFVRTRLFSWTGKMRMGAEMFVPPRLNDADESIGAFMTRRFGTEATEYLAEPLLAGIHAGDVDRLSIRALFPRLAETERAHGSLLLAFRKQRSSAERSRGATTGSAGTLAREPESSAFRSLPGGLSEMTRALVAALPERSIRLQTHVERVLAGQHQPSDPPAYRVDISSGESLTASSVVLAAPAFSVARSVRDLDAHLARLCNEIRYVSTATIALAFPRDAVAHPLNGSGFVVPKVENAGLLAASWLSSKWPHRAPAGRVLLRAFAGGARDPSALQLSDDELVKRAMDALVPLLGLAGLPLLTRVYRWERANAQHEVGHLARMAAIDRALAGHPGLFVTGSGFRGVGIPDCVADGRATARQAAEWLVRSETDAASRI
ncbi:MAG: protoporphyrinogen oxidase [Acidobacteria bacterium RIFCSPLOWO2_02_FULL_65_29]|nr:MAG: protoporphyrinogen oxidase [Acidobacteria bacterium RIFCSPLOWO2_02_FULL_65_29]